MDFLKRAKKEVRSLGFDILFDLQANQAANNKAALLGMAMGTLMFGTIPAFADEASTADIASLGTSIQGIISKIYTASSGVITVLAAVMLVFAFIMRMTGSQQTAAKATSWIVRIIVCFALYNCIGLFFKVIENTASNYTFQKQYSNLAGSGG